MLWFYYFHSLFIDLCLLLCIDRAFARFIGCFLLFDYSTIIRARLSLFRHFPCEYYSVLYSFYIFYLIFFIPSTFIFISSSLLVQSADPSITSRPAQRRNYSQYSTRPRHPLFSSIVFVSSFLPFQRVLLEPTDTAQEIARYRTSRLRVVFRLVRYPPDMARIGCSLQSTE